jgi:hypothetical protein
MTDTLGNLVQQVDTVEFASKKPYAKRLKEKQKDYEEWMKEQKKKKKNGEPYDSVMPIEYLTIKWSMQGQIAPDQNCFFIVDEPLAQCDTSAFHLVSVIDSVETPVDFRLRQVDIRRYQIAADFQQQVNYKLTVDSAAMHSIYGVPTKKMEQKCICSILMYIANCGH